MIKPDIVILHCSDTPDFLPTEIGYDVWGVNDIDAWHRQRGFDKVGYHIVIRRSGIIESGRNCASIPTFEPGAHCKGENLHSIGICYIGRKSPTHMQIESIKKLYEQIKLKFGIYKDHWFGHYQFNPKKTCPGFSIDYIKNLLPDC